MRRRSFLALALLLTPTLATAQDLWSRIDLDPALGLEGLSGIEVSADGTQVQLLNDEANYFAATLTRDGDQLTSLTITQSTKLSGTQDREITPYSSDSEGLAQLTPESPLYVSFEGWARVWRYEDPSETAFYMERMDRFQDMTSNGSLEALGIAPNGALYTIAERHRIRKQRYPMFRYHEGAWDIPFYIPRAVSFAPVGMDIDSDGTIYLLERSFQNYGWRSQVRRFQLDGSGGEVILRTPRNRHDNLEGLAIWHDDQGRLRLLMVADDNLNRVQTSELVEYILPN